MSDQDQTPAKGSMSEFLVDPLPLTIPDLGELTAHGGRIGVRPEGFDYRKVLDSYLQKFSGPFAVFFRFPSARRRILPVTTRIAWLAANRVFNRSFPFTFFENVRLHARYDFGSPILAYYLGLYEESSMHFLVRYLRPEDTFVDVGANVGVYTVLAAGVARARVHAFEPVSIAYDALNQNVSLNALDAQVTLHKHGVGSQAGVAFITTARKGANRIADVNANEAFEKIEVVSLDEALGEAVPAAVKIDVEGYEERVLLGAHRTLSSRESNVVIIEAISRDVDGRGHVDRCVSILEQFGFKLCTFDPSTNSLVECPGEIRSFVGPNDENYLFVKDVRKALERLGKMVT